uniref:Uncharacterized protein n=1 Tax=Arundo donax TaxID=35708 RepID=A0A0A8ZXR0_ARUDO
MSICNNLPVHLDRIQKRGNVLNVSTSKHE